MPPKPAGPCLNAPGSQVPGLTLLAWIRWKFLPCTRKPCSKFLHSSSLHAHMPSARGVAVEGQVNGKRWGEGRSVQIRGRAKVKGVE